MGFDKRTNKFDSIWDIAHKDEDLDDVEIWVYKDGRFNFHKLPKGSTRGHGSFGPETEGSARYIAGRIDHVKRLISVYFGGRPDRTLAKAEYAAKQLQKKYPQYKIYGFNDGGSQGVFIYEETVSENFFYDWMKIGHNGDSELYFWDNRTRDFIDIIDDGEEYSTYPDDGSVTHSYFFGEQPELNKKTFFYGRIDNKTRKISATPNTQRLPVLDKVYDFAKKNFLKFVQKHYRGYKVYMFDEHDKGRMITERRKEINKNRMTIGHHTNPEFIQLYWSDRRGNIELQFAVNPDEVSSIGRDHSYYERQNKSLRKAQFKGRIDHKYREISILPADAKIATKSGYERTVEKIAKTLKKKFKNYSIFFYDDFVKDMMLLEAKKDNTHKYEFKSKTKMNGFVSSLKQLSLGQKITIDDLTVMVTVKKQENLEIIDSLADDYKASLEEVYNIDCISHQLMLNEEIINIDDRQIDLYESARVYMFYDSLNDYNKIRFADLLETDINKALTIANKFGDKND